MTNEITFEASKPDENNQVKVTFKMGAKTYERHVNACFKDNGKYDAIATRSRIEDVLRGVAAKLSVGVIEFLSPEELAARAAPIDAETLPAQE